LMTQEARPELAATFLRLSLGVGILAWSLVQVAQYRAGARARSDKVMALLTAGGMAWALGWGSGNGLVVMSASILLTALWGGRGWGRRKAGETGSSPQIDPE